MEKIVYNLISNAIKYTNNDGAISIHVALENNKCNVRIEDTGEGIPDNQQKHIFQRYYRASNAINSKEVGSGIGLVLTKQLIELHQGKITFESKYHQGSTFKFSIPSNKRSYSENEFRTQLNAENDPMLLNILSSETSEDHTKLSSERTNKETILLVEDNPELLEALQDELSKTYNVLTAIDGQDGLNKAKENIPELIISDVMMPIMNGHQLCIKVKGDLTVCHIPVVLLTALGSDDYKKEGFENGADAYIGKPFDLEILLIQVKNLLRNREILKQKFLIPMSPIDKASPTNKDQILLEKIRVHILENIDNEGLSVESIAQIVGFSRPVLYRKIKALTNLSPQQFVINIKLKEAARIMKEEDRNISETAFMVGFSDPKYFSQTFKKHFGMTPTQFLKK